MFIHITKTRNITFLSSVPKDILLLQNISLEHNFRRTHIFEKRLFKSQNVLFYLFFCVILLTFSDCIVVGDAITINHA